MVSTAAEFVSNLRSSGLIDPEHLRSYLEYLGSTAAADPSVLANRLVADRLLTDFQAEQILKGKSQGFILHGRYKVLRLLGVGGMGRVFLAQHLALGRLVAVKVLPPAASPEPDVRRRFLREARAAAAVDHPNIVRVFDVVEDEENPLIVMEFVDGPSLAELVGDGGPFPLPYAVHCIAQAAAGLQAAADAGLVHRDIKPANLLLDRAGRLKIADLGLAKFRNRGGRDSEVTSAAGADRMLGSADYLAPEQALDSAHVDIRADLYGLGGTFYTLLTGEVPFPEESLAAKVSAHQHAPVPSVRRRRGDVPPEIDGVIAHLMEKRAKDRYPTPAHVLTALAPWMATPVGPPNFAWYARNPPPAVAGFNAEVSTDEVPVLPPEPKMRRRAKPAEVDEGESRDQKRRTINLRIGTAVFLACLAFAAAYVIRRRI